MTKKDSPDMELFISTSMRWGVYLSAAMIVAGLFLLFATGKTGYPAGSFPTSVSTVIAGAQQFKPAAIISLGLFLLIATPIFRVALSVFLFLSEKDYLYTVITFAVFIILIFAITFGKAL